MGEGWGFCSEADRWLSGLPKSFVPVGATALSSCGGRVVGELLALQLLLMRLRVCSMGGYRNRPIKSWVVTSNGTLQNHIHTTVMMK